MATTSQTSPRVEPVRKPAERSPGAIAAPKPGQRPLMIAFLLLSGLIVWVFAPAFRDMAEKWASDPQYSHAYLVPVFALGLAIFRRKQLDLKRCGPDFRGMFLLAFGAMLYTAGGFLYMDFLSAGALIPTLLGAVWLVGGLAALRWAWPMIAFLGFMIPLPYAVETAVGRPLQSIATQGSTWMLQLFGLPAVSEGNVIVLEHGRIAVIEACSGLSMLLTFAALTTGMAMVVKRPLLDKAILILSTIPIAVVVNIARITGNGVGVEIWGPKLAHELFHDQGGWLMMPVAIGLLWLQLWLLRHLLVEVPAENADAFGTFANSRTAPGTRTR